MPDPVIVVGAGPVGLIAAMDLAWRDIPVIVLELRDDEAPAHPRCNTTSARTMEILRRLGCNEKYRACGLAADYPNDVTYSTGITGLEIARLHLPSADAGVMADRVAHDGGWHSAERPHRASQFYLERVLREHALTFEEVDLRFCQEVIGVEQTDCAVNLKVRHTETGEVSTVTGSFVMGCDGGRSSVRKACGIEMAGGYTGLGRNQSIVIRSKDIRPIMERHNGLAWMNWTINEAGRGNMIAIDGKDLWLTHLSLMPDQEGVTPETIDRHVRAVVGQAIEYEVEHTETWQLNRLVAERYREGRVFLAGDAAHIWPPYAGHGMNTGIEDGVALTWMLAAVWQGWAPMELLGAYEKERHNVGEKVSRAAEGLVIQQTKIWKSIEDIAVLRDPGEAGHELRRRIRNELVMTDSVQFNAQGMNFALHYDESPVMEYDGGPPEYEIRNYTPSTVPGCRAPYFAFVEDGVPIFDRIGQGFALLRSDESLDVSDMVEAAQSCGMPLQVIDIEFEPRARDFYDHALVLIRPDDRVAWRSNTLPEDPGAVIDKVRGAA
ncbi:MAG: FAD-dependent monooxygenase [Gammaproteobacteria bacterium]|nr:FAD-dependent monooxygenase [Gammaproteobacteria bacterium]